jgi:mRNA interferase RelE/StbE
VHYQLSVKRSAEKELATLSADLRKHIIARLLALEENPRPPGIKKLQGEEAYRLRVGDYRVLYTIDDEDQIVMVYAVGHRREVYRP